MKKINDRFAYILVSLELYYKKSKKYASIFVNYQI